MKTHRTYWKLLSVIVLLSIIITGCFLFVFEEEESDPTDFCYNIPKLYTSSITSITMTSAVSGGGILCDGNAPIDIKGVCWSTSSFPNADTNMTDDGPGSDSFISVLTGLTPNTEYYVQAYASNSYGTGYGYILSFRTLPEVPVVTTSLVINFTNTTANIGGNVSSEGLTTVTERGIYWGLYPDPDTTGTKIQIGNGAGLFSTDLMGLTPGTTYYVKAYAINSVGSTVGERVSFTTNLIYSLPNFSTDLVSNITTNSVKCGGNVTYDGGASITTRGVCWSTLQNPTISDSKTTDNTGTGTYTSSVINLSANTTYYIRAYAINSLGAAYGNQLSFTTRTDTLFDIEGNLYYSQTIGTQIWMAENLKTTKFNNGKSIPNVTSDATWGVLSTPAYCWYNNDKVTNKVTYGALYNWYAVNTGRLCPAGWHVPSDDEWTTLVTYLGGTGEAGSKLKEAGTAHWDSPNTGTNESGFTALQGGSRSSSSGLFYNEGFGAWWSATEYNATDAWHLSFGHSEDRVYQLHYPKSFGFSIRCVKN